MSDERARASEMLEITDCLEAVGVFRGWKIAFLVIMILGLLILQATFWLIDTGVIDIQDRTENPTEQMATPATLVEDPNALASDVQTAEVNEPESIVKTEAFMSTYWQEILYTLNALVFLCTLLYFLTQLFTMQISVMGRLGGIHHVCRAFFLTLVIMVLIVPWQRLFGGVFPGVLFNPEELIVWQSIKTEGLMMRILYYLRFSGYWLLAMVIIIQSMTRNRRWGQAVLQRLEIV